MFLLFEIISHALPKADNLELLITDIFNEIVTYQI